LSLVFFIFGGAIFLRALLTEERAGFRLSHKGEMMRVVLAVIVVFLNVKSLRGTDQKVEQAGVHEVSYT
jgi:hypothetical protein